MIVRFNKKYYPTVGVHGVSHVAPFTGDIFVSVERNDIS